MRLTSNCFKLFILAFFVLFMSCTSNQQEQTKKADQEEAKPIETVKRQESADKPAEQEKILCERFEPVFPILNTKTT